MAKEQNAQMPLYEKVAHIQNEVTVRKSQHNDFGNYNYRTAEQIYNAVKPLYTKYRINIVMHDTMEEIFGQQMIHTAAWFQDWDTGEQSQTADAFAPLEPKKGMTMAQATGAASSYAHKYAISMLLQLDDEPDPDTNVYQERSGAVKAQPAGPSLISSADMDAISAYTMENPKFAAWLQKNRLDGGRKNLEELTAAQGQEILRMIRQKKQSAGSKPEVHTAREQKAPEAAAEQDAVARITSYAQSNPDFQRFLDSTLNGRQVQVLSPQELADLATSMTRIQQAR